MLRYLTQSNIKIYYQFSLVLHAGEVHDCTVPTISRHKCSRQTSRHCARLIMISLRLATRKQTITIVHMKLSKVRVFFFLLNNVAYTQQQHQKCDNGFNDKVDILCAIKKLAAYCYRQCFILQQKKTKDIVKKIAFESFRTIVSC